MVKGNASAFVPYCVSNYDYGGYHRKLLFWRVLARERGSLVGWLPRLQGSAEHWTALNDAKPHLNQTSTSPLYIYETNSNVVKYLELVTHFYNYYYHCLIHQNCRYLFWQSILNAENRPIRLPYVYRAFTPETGPYKHRIHPNLTPYVMVSFKKFSTHKRCSRLPVHGQRGCPIAERRDVWAPVASWYRGGHRCETWVRARQNEEEC
jgi:hypothetical protein